MRKAEYIPDDAVHIYMKHKVPVNAATSRQLQATINLERFRRDHSAETLDRCIELCTVTSDLFKALGISGMLKLSLYWRAYSFFQQYLHSWGPADTVSESLLEAESPRNRKRVEMTILGGLDAVMNKQRTSAEDKMQSLFRMAFEICRRESRFESMWEWVQRFEARSLSDLLGAASLIPEYLMSEIRSDPDALKLFTRETELRAIQNSQQQGRLRLRGDLYLH